MFHGNFLTPSPTSPCHLYLNIKMPHVYIAPSQTFPITFVTWIVYNVAPINVVYVVLRHRRGYLGSTYLRVE